MLVPLFPVRDHSGRSCWTRNGCHGARRLKRDTCGNFPYQDERCEGLSIIKTRVAETVEDLLRRPYAGLFLHPQEGCKDSRQDPQHRVSHGSALHEGKVGKVRVEHGKSQTRELKEPNTRLRAEARWSTSNTRTETNAGKMNDKLQLFSGFSCLVATCIRSKSASNVLNSASASYAPSSTF